MSTITVAGIAGKAARELELSYAPLSAPLRLACYGHVNTVRDALFKVFGDYPITLEWERHSETLLAMFAAAGDDAGKPYAELRSELKKFRQLVVTVSGGK